MRLLYVKLHRVQREVILAVCDAELLGKHFSDADKHIDVLPSFYGGYEVGEEELGKLISGATIVNLVGRRAVALAIDLGVVDSERVLNIGETVHAQFAVLPE